MRGDRVGGLIRPEVLVIDYIGGPARFELAADGRGGTDLLLMHDGKRAAPDF